MRFSILISILFLYLACNSSTNAKIYSTQTGQVKITLALAIMNAVGTNNQTISSVDANTKEVKLNMKIKDFKFTARMVDRAFKNDYMEVDQYPEASFVGKLKTAINFKSKTLQKIIAEGTLTMHGVSQPKNVTLSITPISNSELKMTTNITINASKYKIDISPNLFASGKDEIKINIQGNYKSN